MSDQRINHDAIRYAALMRLIRGEQWKTCDNCPNQVPVPRVLCPVCEVTNRPPVSSSQENPQ